MTRLLLLIPILFCLSCKIIGGSSDDESASPTIPSTDTIKKIDNGMYIRGGQGHPTILGDQMTITDDQYEIVKWRDGVYYQENGTIIYMYDEITLKPMLIIDPFFFLPSNCNYSLDASINDYGFQLGADGTFDYFSIGPDFAGGDLFVAEPADWIISSETVKNTLILGCI